jgi:cytochrome P450
LTEPREVGAWTLPAGVTTLVPTSLLHRDARVFERPDRFDHARWLGGSEAPSAYFPFGGGARRCVGEPLAHAEIETVIPAVLSRVRPVPVSAEPEKMVQRATVLVPQHELLTRAESGVTLD